MTRCAKLSSVVLIGTTLAFFSAYADTNRTSPKEQFAPLITAAQDVEVNTYVSGDTARYLCDKKIFQFGTGAGTDCWGYRDSNGVEYAIFGIYNGIAVINTQTMTVVGIIPGPENACGNATTGARWRDMKSYKKYVYATSECTGTNAGLIVIDMSNLPTSVNYVASYPVNGVIQTTSHNLSIDTVKGYAYLEGTTIENQSIYIHNLANPPVPVYVNSFGIAGGIHDIYAYNDTVYVAEGPNLSLAIYDVTDKMAPVLLKRWNIPSSGYVHNIWPREDHKYCASTEETPNKTIKIWDIQDLNNVQLVGEVLAPSNLAHNAHWKGNKLYVSHYESGMVEVDVTDPTNPFIDLTYDTYATETPNFHGCWGAYPFTNNGTVYASNLDGRMFILEERNDTLFDTLWTDTTIAPESGQATVTIYASNSHPVRTFQIPLNWAGLTGLSYVGTSRVGTRTDYFQSETQPATDFGSSRMVINLTASTDGTAPDLPAGRGPVLRITFSVPSGTNGITNPIRFTTYTGPTTYEASFASNCIAVRPDTLSGEVHVIGCCVGLRGDANYTGGNPTITDLTFLVSYLFNGGPAPVCPEEANINGVGGITITDLTYLVSYLFNGGPAPAVCP